MMQHHDGIARFLASRGWRQVEPEVLVDARGREVRLDRWRHPSLNWSWPGGCAARLEREAQAEPEGPAGRLLRKEGGRSRRGA